MAGLPEHRFGGLLRWAPWLTLGLLVAPVLAGLLGTLLPAFDFFPALGGKSFGLESWRGLFALPGLWTSVRLSLVTGVLTTAVSLLLVTAFCAAWQGTRLFGLVQRLLSPLLSVPHLTVALGVAFLLAPSGWILRLLSPWATGFRQPPDWLLVQDPNGLSLMLGLIAKEVPFLLVMTLAALGQVDAERSALVARTLGYRPMTGWLKAVFPRVYPQIRLPVFAVLAFGVSVVDMAIVLAPTTPAPLAVRLVQQFNDPDLNLRFIASAGAFLQFGLVISGLTLWLGLEWVVHRVGLRWIMAGHRGGNDFVARWTVTGALGVVVAGVFAGLLAIILWSFATFWRFPNALPDGFTLTNWTRNFSGLQTPLLNTLTVALGLAIGVLEQEARSRRRSPVSTSGVLYLPLVLPQVAFLFGAQMLLVMANLDGFWLALTWIHLVFVFPYVFLSLSEPYRTWDERYGRAGMCLGATPLRVLWRIKLPMLLRAIATAGAVGFAVSVGQYLPTLFAGSGRYPTLTTEAVTLSAGGDHRLIGVYALLQMTLPLAAFAVAIGWPAWRHHHRRGMKISR